jgi:hypothetical protein
VKTRGLAFVPLQEALMAGTVRRLVLPLSARVAAVTAVVLLAACGGGDSSDADSSATGSAAETGAAGTTSASGDSEFCTRAADIDERVDTAIENLGDADPSLQEAFQEITAELRDIEPPDAISADWQALSDGLERISDAFADFDITDPDSLQALEDAGDNLSEASTNVENYLRDECGIEP